MRKLSLMKKTRKDIRWKYKENKETLQNILSEDDISLETLVAYKKEVMDASEAEKG